MDERTSRRRALSRCVHLAAISAITALVSITGGCNRNAGQSAGLPPTPGGTTITVIAALNPDAECYQPTLDIIHTIEAASPERIQVRIIDTTAESGRQQLEELGLEAVPTIIIDGLTTVTWVSDERRTVNFTHPPGFAWTNEDLNEALQAALDGTLRAAEPEEAEGVRTLDISIRGQSVRVDDGDGETGQLVIEDRVVLEVTRPRGDLAPGQRVTVAARGIQKALEEPFTPDDLVLQRVEDGIALFAGEEELLVATAADGEADDTSLETLATRWRSAVRYALIEAAIR